MQDMSATVDSTLLSTPHDRQRREERNVDGDLRQQARRYGMSLPGKWKGSKRYFYAKHVFVFNERTKEAITSWKVKRNGKSAGTSRVKPILVTPSSQHATPQAIKMHNRLANELRTQKAKWRTHSVFVVDMSGSMRTDDVDGARCRSDAVWTVLARDFVKQQLDSGTASVYDMVSVILMNDSANTPLRYEPLSWVLYNKLVAFRDWETSKPQGNGYYIPALEKAEQVLSYNQNCSLSLFFCSDGIPSEPVNRRDDIILAVKNIASKFGRQLVVSCVGIACERAVDFEMLKQMASEAEGYGCQSKFHHPKMNTTALTSIVSSIRSSMAPSVMELSGSGGRVVRSDIVREHKNASDDKAVGPDWRHFRAKRTGSLWTKAVYAWKESDQDFATVIDHRCIGCSATVADSMTFSVDSSQGCMCFGCSACYFCPDCFRKRHELHDCSGMLEQRRQGFLIRRALPSLDVAWKKQAFGEGAERLAFKFRFVGMDGKTFIGPKMVAKESRFVENKEEEGDSVHYIMSHRHKYHKSFMQTQAISSRFASMYNDTLDEIANAFESNRFAKKLKRYPRIRFVDPLVFELEEVKEGGAHKLYNLLVEPMIHGEYRKWNNNFGVVELRLQPEDYSDTVAGCSHIDLKSIAFLLGQRNMKTPDQISSQPRAKVIPCPLATISNNPFHELGAILEEEEKEEDDSNESYSSEGSVSENASKQNAELQNMEEEPSENSCFQFDRLLAASADLAPPERSFTSIAHEDFAQAFSHFSYVRSGGKLMVVDLQGALHIDGTDGAVEFVFTDPAMHKRKGAYRRHQFRLNFGRTDRGTLGIYAFFDSHVCNDACRLLGLRPKLRQNEFRDDVGASLQSGTAS